MGKPHIRLRHGQRKMRISDVAIAAAAFREQQEFQPYEPPPGVIPPKEKRQALAMDATPYDYLNMQVAAGSGPFVGYYFPGYQTLASLAQLPEYRKMSAVPAREMVRKWIKLNGTGGEDKSDKIDVIERELKRHNIRDLFRQAAEMDGYFGRCQLYIDVRTPKGIPARADRDELQRPLIYSEHKITKGSLGGFRLVEPLWTYPSAYNADDPLSDDFYKPSQWYVMGRTVHRTRLLNFVSRPVPDLIKPAYNFGGMSMSQMAQPYVEHWVRTRNSVSDMLHSFSISGLKTNMESVLTGATDAQFQKRAALFNQVRDNRGLMMLDKETEEFFQFNTPLGGLHELQAQSQEHLSAVSSIPLVLFAGITPTGLNASSEGEIRVFYDYVSSVQEFLLRPNLEKVIQIIQLDQFGEIDHEIDFAFEPLYGLDETQAAQVRANDAQADAEYVSIGALSPDEVRQRLANSPDSGYEGLEIDEGEDDTDLLAARENLLQTGAREGGDPDQDDPDAGDPGEREDVIRTKARVNDR